jgi:hypothetical protein
MRSILTPLLFLALATPASASDGVLEINQTCARETGCFSGDTPGYPVTINGSAGRSYKLTSDIGGVIGLNTNVIEIIADDITIDLAGFRIICTTFTPPFTVAFCSDSGSGTGDGITVDDTSTRKGVEVRNGSVTGVAGAGVRVGDRSVVRGMRISSTGGHGISAGENTVVSSNLVVESGLGGGGFSLFTIFAIYRDNVFDTEFGGGRGNINGTGTNAGGNVCSGTPC